MLSLAQPNHFYQCFLSQGVCAGIGAGMLYVPSYAVVGHYFLKRRTLIMSIVASGSSLGAVIHPIMLNNTFNTLGFGNAVRASAGLVSGMLLIACLLMRTRLPPPGKTTPLIPAIKRFSQDWAYIFATLGYVSSHLSRDENAELLSSLLSFTIAFYFPFYYLQLDASAHNLNVTFTFYSVAYFSPIFLRNNSHALHILIACHIELGQLHRPAGGRLCCPGLRCRQHDYAVHTLLCRAHLRYDWREDPR